MSNTTAQLFFAGSDVWPLFASKMTSSSSYIGFVHTTYSSQSVLGAFTFYNDTIDSAALSANYTIN